MDIVTILKLDVMKMNDKIKLLNGNILNETRLLMDKKARVNFYKNYGVNIIVEMFGLKLYPYQKMFLEECISEEEKNIDKLLTFLLEEIWFIIG